MMAMEKPETKEAEVNVDDKELCYCGKRDGENWVECDNK